MTELDPGQQREELLDQLSYLLDEIHATRPFLDRLEAAPPVFSNREPSVKACYGALVEWDIERVLPALRGHAETVRTKPQPWDDHSVKDIIERVELTRREVLTAARGLDPAVWGDELHDILYATVQHDVDMLRSVAVQMHRSG